MNKVRDSFNDSTGDYSNQASKSNDFYGHKDHEQWDHLTNCNNDDHQKRYYMEYGPNVEKNDTKPLESCLKMYNTQTFDGEGLYHNDTRSAMVPTPVMIYDAFLSYSNNDERFVLDNIVTRLEQYFK